MIGRTVIDCRTGRRDLHAVLPEGVKRLMQVPDEMRKCVVFLYYRKKDDPTVILPAGTAFFVGYPVPGHEPRALTLLLTAHHVIAGIRELSDDNQVLIRLNTKAGDSTWAEVSSNGWHQPDTAVDFAMLLWQPPAEMNADYRGWYLGASATEAGIRAEGIGLGDEVFMVGLFRNHLGRDRNEPIVRVGNIAAMPADPIRTKAYGDMKAILVEARSIGGLSGAPVFVHLGFMRWREGQISQWTPNAAASTGPFFFLGLMHGHWEALEAEVDITGSNEKVNMGVGIVVPADQISRAMGAVIEEVAKVRKQQLDEEGEAASPTPDSAVDDESEWERFEDLTRKLVNTPKPEKQKDES